MMYYGANAFQPVYALIIISLLAVLVILDFVLIDIWIHRLNRK